MEVSIETSMTNYTGFSVLMANLLGQEEKLKCSQFLPGCAKYSKDISKSVTHLQIFPEKTQLHNIGIPI